MEIVMRKFDKTLIPFITAGLSVDLMFYLFFNMLTGGFCGGVYEKPCDLINIPLVLFIIAANVLVISIIYIQSKNYG